MGFSELAVLTIHDVKNNLAQLVADAESRGDMASMQVAQHASEALTRLLCYYRSEAHFLDIVVEPASPAELIDDLIQALANHRREHQDIKLEIDLSQAPAIGFFDKTLIQMVLANAMQNALRYAKSTVQLTIIEQDEHMEICLHDDGAGYPEGVLTDPDNSPVTEQGTGLGLRLARRVLALHVNQGRCGEIILSNDGGAVFRLILP